MSSRERATRSSTTRARFRAATFAAAALNVLAAGGCVDGPVEPPASTACAGREIAVLAPAKFEALVIDGASTTCFALAGGGAEYLLLPQLTGATLPYGGYGFRFGTADAAPAPTSPVLASPAAPPLAIDDPQARLDARLRSLEAMFGAPRAGSGTAAQPRAETGDPGSQRGFQVLATLDVTPTFANVVATQAYQGARILLYLDTAAVGAYTAPELEEVGRRLDEQLAPAIFSAFGAGSDIDANGRVIVLLTPIVNAMVSAASCAGSGFVRGFFNPHDLASTAPTSNVGEIFYAYVPDPDGRWSCAHSKTTAASNVAPTFVHELQHLISYGEHVVRRGGPAEEPWLNEGLSHVAEELGSLVYERRYPPPLGRTDPSQLFPDSAAPFITPNLTYAYRYLFSSAFYSVTGCAPGSFCSLAERGGTWLLLRWLADQSGDALFRALLETPLVGRGNLEAATGRSTAGILADFSIAASVDSLSGQPRDVLGSTHRFVSRNPRQLFAALHQAYGLPGGIPRPHPVEPLMIDAGASVTGTMRPGTFVAYRVKTGEEVPAARLQFVGPDGTSFPQTSGAQVSVLRLR